MRWIKDINEQWAKACFPVLQYSKRSMSFTNAIKFVRTQRPSVSMKAIRILITAKSAIVLKALAEGTVTKEQNQLKLIVEAIIK